MANEDQNNNNNEDFQRGLLLDTKPKTKKPSMYNVLLLNDDYTPMEFVVMVLEKIFNKNKKRQRKLCYMFIKMVLEFVEHLLMR